MDLGFAIGLDGSGNIYVWGYSLATWGSPIRAFVVAADQFRPSSTPPAACSGTPSLGDGQRLQQRPGRGRERQLLCGRRQPGDLGLPGQSHGGLSRRLPGLDDRQNQRQRVLQWNTFHGGTNHDYAYGAALDASGGLYVVGESRTTWGTPLSSYSGGSDITVVKLNASTGASQWHTFYGQAGTDRPMGLRSTAAAISSSSAPAARRGARRSTHSPAAARMGSLSDSSPTGRFWGILSSGGPEMTVAARGVDKAGTIYLGGFSTPPGARRISPMAGAPRTGSSSGSA